MCLHAQDQMQRKLGTQMKLSLGFAISLLKVSRKNILECKINKIQNLWNDIDYYMNLWRATTKLMNVT